MRRCPSLRLLATSREGLRVGGETIWPVPPLATDDAVQLFVARAQAAGAPLALSDDVLAVVSEICVRLDGLPLAIELAAARTRAFPIQQIASRLNDRFRLLTGGSRTALPRQQTLRAVVDWSYELLFDDEQRVFERLSVFPGGCDLATAEAVCADETLDAADLADIIQTLVDKSLVIAVPTGDELRFTQLQTLAQYGREKLAERGDSERIRDAMAAHYGRLCAGSAAAFVGDDQRAWLTAVDREQDNLRGALEWAVANDDAETALTIAGGVSWPHWLAGTAVEGKRWLDDAFRCEGEASERARGAGADGPGADRLPAGHTGERRCRPGSRARRSSVSSDDVESIAMAYSFYAEVAAARGDIDEGRRRRLEVLDFYLGLPDDSFVIAARAYSRAKLGVLDGDLAQAERYYREAARGLLPDRPTDDALDVPGHGRRLRRAPRRLPQPRSTIWTRPSRPTTRVGLRGFNGSLLARLGWALLQDGDPARAELAYNRAPGRRPPAEQHAGDLPRPHRAGRAAPAPRSQRRQRPRRRPKRSTSTSPASPRRLANRVDARADVLAGAAVCCAVLGILAAEEGDGEQAARLLGHAERLRHDAGAPVPRFQRDDLDRARRGGRARCSARTPFRAAFELGQHGQLGHERGLHTLIDQALHRR